MLNAETWCVTRLRCASARQVRDAKAKAWNTGLESPVNRRLESLRYDDARVRQAVLGLLVWADGVFLPPTVAPAKHLRNLRIYTFLFTFFTDNF